MAKLTAPEIIYGLEQGKIITDGVLFLGWDKQSKRFYVEEHNGNNFIQLTIDDLKDNWEIVNE